LGASWASRTRGRGRAVRVIGVRGSASPDRFGTLPLRTLVSDVRPRPPAHLHCLPPLLLPLSPPAPHLHAHFSSRTHHESAAAPSCLFWLVPDACFHTGATSAARSQAMLAGLVPLCNWGRSHIRPTQRQSHARHSTNRSLRHSTKHMPATAPSICSSQRPPLHTPALNTRRVGHTRHSARGK
jgi:hypothetical protein